ncbi:riboflavin synthase subunit alpha [Shewanella chilikensis]|uniref:riboflavin synthase subunit alpha n=1 Tax=Shewanella chilikensis TaxID=558541 RepID=UPI001F24A68F|nr:riboflavin synthase subunit alpha [Shewanella chilikensis]MCE9786874.1 riboflavin synthase subunit alpha [Shewanella chilikensis]
MFTGIVQAKCEILAIEKKPGLSTLEVALSPALREGLEIGASVANNGVCLTVTQLADDRAFFDVMEETLAVTNLVSLKVGDKVNIERSLKFGAELGGHILSGHVHTQAQLVQLDVSDSHYNMQLEVAEAWLKYIFYKGFIGINGCSLTVGEVKGNRFMLHLIPETLRLTNLQDYREGDWLNIEIDSQTQTIVDTVERVLAQRNLGH